MKNLKENEISIENELINSYLSYALSVIIGRALPDVRDGLKPVHRRTIFVMKELNNTFDKNYKKSARIVGDVIGKYHPHGENAVYESIVRLSQNFIQRYPLIDGQGNFGSLDGDSAAAMRYTEIRLTELSEYLIKDLNYSTVKYIYNYDNTEKYPSIFPSMFPNILINGSYGIAVGMSTNIPPHNIKEILNGCIIYLKKKYISNNDLMQYILAPDFPTFGNIFRINDIKNIYNFGKGKIIIRSNSKIHFENKICQIFITELPYQINKISLLIKINNLIKNKKIIGVKNIRDDSDKEGIRITFLIDKNKDIKSIIKLLYNISNLKSTININMLCIVNNIPKLLNLKKTIKCFLKYRKTIIIKRTNNLISKIKNKLYLLFILCITIIYSPKILQIIVKSKNINKLKRNFQNLKFKHKHFFNSKIFNFLISKKNKKIFSKKQIKLILNLKFNNLIGTKKNKILNTYILYIKDYFFYKCLFKKQYIKKIIKEELIFIKKKFGDNRKTKIFEKK